MQFQLDTDSVKSERLPLIPKDDKRPRLSSSCVTDSSAQSNQSSPSLRTVSTPIFHHGENSNGLTAALIIGDAVGASVLSMTLMAAKVGWLIAVLLNIFMCLINWHTSCLMWRVLMHTEYVRGYPELVKLAFEHAPLSQSSAAQLLIQFSQYGYLVLDLGLYSLSIGKALGMVFYDVHMCLTVFMAIGCSFVVPLVVGGGKVGSWKVLLWVNILSILCSILIPLGVMMQDGVKVTRQPGSNFEAVEDLSFGKVIEAITITAMSYSVQFLVTEITVEMREPESFPMTYGAIAAPFQIGISVLVCILGYYYVGDATTGMLAQNIEFGAPFRVAAACLLLHMCVAWLIKGTVVCSALYRWIASPDSENNPTMTNCVWPVICVGVMSCTWLIAQLVPFFEELIDLLGSTFVPICCFIMPVLMYLRWRKDAVDDLEADADPNDPTIPAGSWVTIESGLMCFEVVFAVFIFFAGTFFAMRSIVMEWENFGVPFSCHCEAMWNTCECSASHRGMEGVCPADELPVRHVMKPVWH